jgi:hypothetical protein
LILILFCFGKNKENERRNKNTFSPSSFLEKQKDGERRKSRIPSSLLFLLDGMREKKS